MRWWLFYILYIVSKIKRFNIYEDIMKMLGFYTYTAPLGFGIGYAIAISISNSIKSLNPQ